MFLVMCELRTNRVTLLSCEKIISTLRKANMHTRRYWGMSPRITGWNDEGTSCSLVFVTETPLEEFVEIPEKYRGLQYSQILCGVIRGGLETVSMKTNCRLVRDRLAGDDVTEVRIDLLEIQREMAGEDYRES